MHPSIKTAKSLEKLGKVNCFADERAWKRCNNFIINMINSDYLYKCADMGGSVKLYAYFFPKNPDYDAVTQIYTLGQYGNLYEYFTDGDILIAESRMYNEDIEFHFFNNVRIELATYDLCNLSIQRHLYTWLDNFYEIKKLAKY